MGWGANSGTHNLLSKTEKLALRMSTTLLSELLQNIKSEEKDAFKKPDWLNYISLIVIFFIPRAIRPLKNKLATIMFKHSKCG